VGYGVQLIQTKSQIYERIRRKSSHYGELDIPYLLALNISDLMADMDDFTDAVLGSEAFLYDFETDEIQPFRKRDGAWFGPNGPHNKRMSGILLFQQLRPESIHICEPVLWHHPFANIPLNFYSFPFIQQIPNREKGKYELRPGLNSHEHLSVDPKKMP
jgi:hypothetical protein